MASALIVVVLFPDSCLKKFSLDANWDCPLRKTWSSDIGHVHSLARTTGALAFYQKISQSQ